MRVDDGAARRGRRAPVHRPGRRHRRPRRPRRRRASGPSCSPSTARRCAPASATSGRRRRGRGRPWRGPPIDAWRSSLDRDGYVAGVGAIREAIAAGDVYQVNLCRVLAAPLPAGRRRRRPRRRPGRGQPGALRRRRAPARATACTWRRRRPSGSCAATATVVESKPIKGTAADARRLPRQGPGRERDDRRPRPQRPRPGVRARAR